jgi:hypothetical protein
MFNGINVNICLLRELTIILTSYYSQPISDFCVVVKKIELCRNPC